MANSQDNPVRQYPEGFSLIELLVVIFILSLLTALLLPSLFKARLLAKKIACMTQFSSLGKAAGLYQTDYEGYVPVCIRNCPSTYPKPWKSWRMNLLPYIPSVEVFNCAAAEDIGYGWEIIKSVEDLADQSLTGMVGAMNLGSYGVIDHELHDTYKTMTYSGTEGYGDPVWSCAFPVTPGVYWEDPNNSIYIADARLVRGPIQYPTQPPHKGGGTSCINWPLGGNEIDYQSETMNVRRFADRHKGTNCLFLDGHVETFVTEKLDTMIEGESDCVWDWK
jgi:prepilin-type N-terminal cleavage/methylation domain-containing protein/prepilin-type processing-associated H-X9-DG protein